MEQEDGQSEADGVLSEVAGQIEAALMVSDRPLTAARLSEVVDDGSTAAIKQAVADLNALYERTGRSFRIERIAGGWQILTLARYAAVTASIRKTRAITRLGPAAMETLAIVAYKQPVLRADIEAIRGVACGEVLRGLMERKLIRIAGRAEELGRPMLYGTTSRFLELFGLAGLKDLPPVDQFQPPRLPPEVVPEAPPEVSPEAPPEPPPEPPPEAAAEGEPPPPVDGQSDVPDAESQVDTEPREDE